LQEDLENEEFSWDLLIEMLIIESSPLAEIFGTKTLQLAELYHTAKHLSTIAHDIDNHDNDIVDEDVSNKIRQSKEEADQKSADEFADFEDV
jgi:hypothetical protein